MSKMIIEYKTKDGYAWHPLSAGLNPLFDYLELEKTIEDARTGELYKRHGFDIDSDQFGLRTTKADGSVILHVPYDFSNEAEQSSYDDYVNNTPRPQGIFKGLTNAAVSQLSSLERSTIELNYFSEEKKRCEDLIGTSKLSNDENYTALVETVLMLKSRVVKLNKEA